jgi:hypothetical protein
LVLLDALGAGGSGVSVRRADAVRSEAEATLMKLASTIDNNNGDDVDDERNTDNNDDDDVRLPIESSETSFGIPPFSIARGPIAPLSSADSFSLQAPVLF